MKPMETVEAVQVLKRVWGGMSIIDACHRDQSLRRNFYGWCEVNGVEPPKKGDIASKVVKQAQSLKKITKKDLSNESLSTQIRKGVYQNADNCSSWARVGISYLDLDSKANTSTVTPQEYRALIVDLFCNGKDPKKKRATKPGEAS